MLEGSLDCLVTAGSAQQRTGGSGVRGGGEPCGVFAQGPGEAAEGAAAAGRSRLAFQPGHGGGADPGPAGELFLGQSALAA